MNNNVICLEERRRKKRGKQNPGPTSPVGSAKVVKPIIVNAVSQKAA
ncbi:hypothetical protein SYNTR_0711 [Candidatus Syntrophocurvum alkaliphilum]|uniref:Uncharacterized protein n=1 Tax=Candidatus Syntrophocurvum alkaliphilum TaxID=2293317 RepID=A0A6I6DF89_9FIRM|nr:hypothetical protein [Candidatus Syntrophocurvum alkaliphilum]QGT99304.1 hypothetical protein SYNTR_0711 [Candidatus Syntrophocurvum alkaliphilum]